MTKTYREELERVVTELESLMRAQYKAEDAPLIPFEYGGLAFNLRNRSERNEAVTLVSAAYILAHNSFNEDLRQRYFERGGSGEGPVLVSVDTELLVRMTNVLLYEELADEDPYKTQHNEYPFYSDTQLERRREGRRGSENTNMRGETALKEDTGAGPGVVIAMDRRTCAEPTRRKRSAREHSHVDNGAQIRNKARSAQYKRDTAEGPVKSYNLRDTGGELTEEFTQRRGIGARWLSDMFTANEIVIEPAEVGAELYVKEAA